MGRKHRKYKEHVDTSAGGIGKAKLREIMVFVHQLLELCSSKPSINVEWAEYMEIHNVVEKIRAHQQGHVLPSYRRDDHLDELTSWLQENGVDISKATVSKTTNGYGLVAIEDITEAELFLRVPRKVMMTVDSAKRSSLGEMIATDAILKAMPNVALALHLLNERCNPGSFWGPYINTLPEAYTTPLNFTSEEILILKGSPVFGEILSQYKNIARQYAYFYKAFQAQKSASDVLLKNQFCFDDYRWAVSAVMTRQNQIPCKDGDHRTNALIPYWDMCNHTNGQITTDFNLERDCSECYALQDFKKGEEILLFYGPRSNAEFLHHSGFVYDENRMDNLAIKLGISTRDSLYSLKSDILGKSGIAVNGTFIINSRPGLEPDLLGFLRVFSMSEEQLKAIDDVQMLVDAQFPVPTEIDVKVWSFLETRTNLLLRSYATSIEKDEQELRENNELTEHEMLAIKLALCEKRILRHTSELAGNRKKASSEINEEETTV